MKHTKPIRRVSVLLIFALAFALCGAPEVLAQTAAAAPQAQTTPQANPGKLWDDPQPQPAPPAMAQPTPPAAQPNPSIAQPQPSAPAQDTPTAPPTAAQQNRGTTVDPSAGPLVPDNAPQQNLPQPNAPDGALPNAPSATASEQPPQTAPRPRPQQPAPEPLGTAAAESVRTTGLGASKPAGTAIAPARQRQMRSLLIKLGAVAAAGIAIGTVYGLSKGTPSVPPNSGR